MAVHIQTQITEAMHEHLKLLTLPSGVEIAWPNVEFAAGKKPYLRVENSPNVPVNPRIAFGKDPIRMGIYQVSAHGKKNKGESDIADLAGLVSDHFKRGTKIAIGPLQIIILDDPNISPSLSDKDGHQVPVQISWTLYPA